MRTEDHGDFLSINHESLLLKVGFENPISATQRKAHIVTELFTFTGELAACCHNFYFHLLFFTIFTSVRCFSVSVKNCGEG